MKLIDADYLIDTIGAMIGYGTTPTDIWDMIHRRRPRRVSEEDAYKDVPCEYVKESD